VVLYFSWPSELAARLSVCPPAAAGAVEVAVLDVAELEVAAGVEAEELVLLEELPQPLRASSPIASASNEAFGR
jgi:hypothetical protein